MNGNIHLFKSNPAMERNNYRHISIMPILSKVLEWFVHTSFTVFLEQFKLLIVAQSAFSQLHHTVTAPGYWPLAWKYRQGFGNWGCIYWFT